MDPLKTYDYLTTTRNRLFDVLQTLNESSWNREFEIGLGTLARTLTHVMISEWYYVQRITRCDVPPYAAWPIQQESPPAVAVIGSTWTRQAIETRAALAGIDDWATTIEYLVVPDDGPPQIVTTSAGDLFTQLVTHEIHHRAQAMTMLRQLGHPIDSLDFNAFFARRSAV